MNTHNICFHGEIRKNHVDTPSYLELCDSVGSDTFYDLGFNCLLRPAVNLLKAPYSLK